MAKKDGGELGCGKPLIYRAHLVISIHAAKLKPSV